ncbi:MAG: hypothetical protein KAK04_05000 [Cyclobacteriaceae bacterium]|nr:hypothetical protein [Cyclobacteriaceae bacterium]
MYQPEKQFNSIVSKFTSLDQDVHLGKMMSSPGLKYKDKLFAFYHKETMGFRLGPNFNPEKIGLKNAKPLSPFKKKPPLKGWVIIEQYESDTWEMLTEMSLEYTKTLK